MMKQSPSGELGGVVGLMHETCSYVEKEESHARKKASGPRVKGSRPAAIGPMLLGLGFIVGGLLCWVKRGDNLMGLARFQWALGPTKIPKIKIT